MTTELLNQVYLREETVDGSGPWVWPKGDNGAWDGPKTDWETSHKFLYMKYLKDNKSVFTAGANCGMYARLYSHLFETVWAFEPDPLNFYCLIQNAQRENIIKVQSAVGAFNGTIAMSRNDMTNVGMHTVAPLSHEGTIPIMRIDSLNLPHLSLLQLDVERYEFQALTGAVETITKFKPVVAVELGTTDNIIKLMTDLGYVNADQSISDTIWIPKP